MDNLPLPVPPSFFNNTVACASCHLQENAFTDPAQFSVGFDGGLTGRNSMSLAHAKYYNGRNPGGNPNGINGPRFFWDERAATLEDQVLLPRAQRQQAKLQPKRREASILLSSLPERRIHT